MPLRYGEFKEQLAADMAASEERRPLTTAEDEYFEKIGREIDKRPIGVPRGRRAGRMNTPLD